jgi:hypothetical protein
LETRGIDVRHSLSTSKPNHDNRFPSASSRQTAARRLQQRGRGRGRGGDLTRERVDKLLEEPAAVDTRLVQPLVVHKRHLRAPAPPRARRQRGAARGRPRAAQRPDGLLNRPTPDPSPLIFVRAQVGRSGAGGSSGAGDTRLHSALEVWPERVQLQVRVVHHARTLHLQLRSKRRFSRPRAPPPRALVRWGDTWGEGSGSKRARLSPASAR